MESECVPIANERLAPLATALAIASRFGVPVFGVNGMRKKAVDVCWIEMASSAARAEFQITRMG